jgi:hypothetical protein
MKILCLKLIVVVNWLLTLNILIYAFIHKIGNTDSFISLIDSINFTLEYKIYDIIRSKQMTKLSHIVSIAYSI